MSKKTLLNPMNEWLELIDQHEGFLCRMRTNNAPLRCGAKATHMHHFDVQGKKGTTHHMSSLCLRHAEIVATALKVKLPVPSNRPSISESMADELMMLIKQQQSLTRQIEVGIERCRTMLRILKESNERKYQ